MSNNPYFYHVISIVRNIVHIIRLKLDVRIFRTVILSLRGKKSPGYYDVCTFSVHSVSISDYYRIKSTMLIPTSQNSRS